MYVKINTSCQDLMKSPIKHVSIQRALCAQNLDQTVCYEGKVPDKSLKFTCDPAL